MFGFVVAGKSSFVSKHLSTGTGTPDLWKQIFIKHLLIFVLTLDSSEELVVSPSDTRNDDIRAMEASSCSWCSLWLRCLSTHFFLFLCCVRYAWPRTAKPHRSQLTPPEVAMLTVSSIVLLDAFPELLLFDAVGSLAVLLNGTSGAVLLDT